MFYIINNSVKYSISFRSKNCCRNSFIQGRWQTGSKQFDLCACFCLQSCWKVCKWPVGRTPEKHSLLYPIWILTTIVVRANLEKGGVVRWLLLDLHKVYDTDNIILIPTHTRTCNTGVVRGSILGLCYPAWASMMFHLCVMM